MAEIMTEVMDLENTSRENISAQNNPTKIRSSKRVFEKASQANSLTSYSIATFYKFIHLKDLETIRAKLKEAAQQNDVRGLIILGAEGINSTVCAPSRENLEAFKNFIRSEFQAPDLMFKHSSSETLPFRRFVVKIRDEIVTLGTPELFPDAEKNHHLSSEEWNQVLKEENDFLLVDTRNWYETKIGTFKGAVNPGIDKFTEFPEWLEKQNYDKSKKLLIFCTGGIRCEKGILDLQRMGYHNVYQLEGGILKYLEDKPHDQFEGECFVFDHRVAVRQDLTPSKDYKLCPHCGQPGKIQIDCKRCDSRAVICESCQELEVKKDTCSKNCAHHYSLHPERKGQKQQVPFDIGPI